MEAGVRRLADREEPRQVRAPVEVGDHAAAGVVGRRHHRDRLPGDVDAQLQAAGMDRREVLLEEGLAEVRGVEPDVVEAVLLHLEVDRPGHDVARRQLQARVVVGHEARAVGEREVGALAAQRLADEEGALLRVVEAGRVELDELHVPDPAAGPPGHGDPVAGRGVRVRRVAVDLADAAGREHDGRRRKRLDALPVDVERVDAVAAGGLVAVEMARGDQVDRHPALAHRDVRVAAGAGEERLVDRPAGRVGGVGDAPDGVAALPRQVQAQRPLGIRRERHALLDEPLDRLAAVLGDEARRVLVDQAGPGLLGVADVEVDAVVVAQHAHDAALGPRGGRLVEAALGEQDDRVPIGEMEGDRQSGEAGTRR